MNWKENVRKYWWVGAILIALIVLFRPRQPQQTTVSRLAAVEAVKPTGDGLMEQTLQRLGIEEAQRSSRVAAAQETLAIQGLKSQGELQALQTSYQASVLRGQTIVQERLAQAAKKVGTACRRGKAKLDLSTGQIYCREEETKGPSVGGISVYDNLKRLNDLAWQYFQAQMGGSGGYGGGTPPFVPS